MKTKNQKWIYRGYTIGGLCEDTRKSDNDHSS